MTHQTAHTVDAFHRGRFWLVQPKRGGHRAGADALLLAAAVPSDFAGGLADFGAGAGAAGLAIASRCPGASVTLVEQSAEMAEFAALTLANERNAWLNSRAALLVADVTLSGAAREKAGLLSNSFDLVVMNPPFNEPANRASPDAVKRQAHVMTEGMFESWIKSAAAVVRPRGGIAIIARPVSMPAILAALDGRFGAAQILPVHARADDAAIRIVVRARRASRGSLSLEGPLVLHGPGQDGFTARAEAIFDGVLSLFGD